MKKTAFSQIILLKFKMLLCHIAVLLIFVPLGQSSRGYNYPFGIPYNNKIFYEFSRPKQVNFPFANQHEGDIVRIPIKQPLNAFGGNFGFQLHGEKKPSQIPFSHRVPNQHYTITTTNQPTLRVPPRLNSYNAPGGIPYGDINSHHRHIQFLDYSNVPKDTFKGTEQPRKWPESFELSEKKEIMKRHKIRLPPPIYENQPSRPDIPTNSLGFFMNDVPKPQHGVPSFSGPSYLLNNDDNIDGEPLSSEELDRFNLRESDGTTSPKETSKETAPSSKVETTSNKVIWLDLVDESSEDEHNDFLYQKHQPENQESQVGHKTKANSNTKEKIKPRKPSPKIIQVTKQPVKQSSLKRLQTAKKSKIITSPPKKVSPKSNKEATKHIATVDNNLKPINHPKTSSKVVNTGAKPINIGENQASKANSKGSEQPPINKLATNPKPIEEVRKRTQNSTCGRTGLSKKILVWTPRSEDDRLGKFIAFNTAYANVNLRVSKNGSTLVYAANPFRLAVYSYEMFRRKTDRREIYEDGRISLNEATILTKGGVIARLSREKSLIVYNTTGVFKNSRKAFEVLLLGKELFNLVPLNTKSKLDIDIEDISKRLEEEREGEEYQRRSEQENLRSKVQKKLKPFSSSYSPEKGTKVVIFSGFLKDDIIKNKDMIMEKAKGSVTDFSGFFSGLIKEIGDKSRLKIGGEMIVADMGDVALAPSKTKNK